ncbi:sigma-70 family RNA polymerase sigma factor [Enterococcus lemanii]|jgi:hypothetical protein|uniref:Sigma-70 family RNA polymerase sigma factor n=1 Tax=Enterococcus lemanii TaxID=1159752 RepID=A0ABV9MV83_9ENTE|nr:sigma-70 family RNA polymerase sigma factor [Enterococcus lemanii]MBM7709055.1 hypothetical protein [Enterococcus lemanii]
MTNEELDELIQDYEGLFRKVLQRCGLFPGQADFEDYLQELRVLFYLRAKEYASRGLFEMDNEVTYLFKFLLWRIVDQKRKKMIQIKEVEEEILVNLQIQIEPKFEAVETATTFTAFYERLTIKDRQKCQALLEDETISRQQRSRYRAYFKKQFQNFFS